MPGQACAKCHAAVCHLPGLLYGFAGFRSCRMIHALRPDEDLPGFKNRADLAPLSQEQWTVGAGSRFGWRMTSPGAVLSLERNRVLSDF